MKKAAKILLLPNSHFTKKVQRAFIELGQKGVRSDCLAAKEDFFHLVDQVKPDLVFSINSYPGLIRWTSELGIPYCAWLVDHPVWPIYNFPFPEFPQNSQLFVHMESTRLSFLERGFPEERLHYLPLGADPYPQVQLQNISSPVCFVGHTGLANEFNSFKFSKEAKSYLHQLFSHQSHFCKKSIFTPLFSNPLSEYFPDEFTPTYMTKAEYISFVLDKKFHELSRRELIKKISENYTCDVYGDENWKQFLSPNAHYVKLATTEELPSIFGSYPINISHNRIGNDSGVALRTFEVLASKGFLLSKESEGLENMFSKGKDYACYSSCEELKDSIRYYLDHEKEREEICAQGHETLIKSHTLVHRIKKILDLVQANE